MKNMFSFSIVLVVAVFTIALIVPATADDGSGITIQAKGDSSTPPTGRVEGIKITSSSIPMPDQNDSVSADNWRQPPQPVPQIIVVTQQVVLIQQAPPVVIVNKCGFFSRLFCWGGASAYAEVNVGSYGGYYPTYWDNSPYRGGYYRHTQRLYSGHRGGYSGNGGGHGGQFIQNYVPPGGLYPYQSGPLVGHGR